MESLPIHLDGDGCWPDLIEKGFTEATGVEIAPGQRWRSPEDPAHVYELLDPLEDDRYDDLVRATIVKGHRSHGRRDTGAVVLLRRADFGRRLVPEWCS